MVGWNILVDSKTFISLPASHLRYDELDGSHPWHGKYASEEAALLEGGLYKKFYKSLAATFLPEICPVED